MSIFFISADVRTFIGHALNTVIYNARIELGKLFIESIMKPYEEPYKDVLDIDNMRVLRDVLSLEAAGKNNVIIRYKITEEFWSAVIATTIEYRVCAVGTPGIGKTTSTCILIRLLLQQQHTVLYHVRTKEKEGVVYLFTPQAGSTTAIDVQVEGERKFNRLDSKYNNETIYYVVDPGKTKDDCDPPNAFLGKVIIVASPDEGHWGGSNFKKDRNGMSGIFLYYPVWEVHELIAARKFLGSNLSEDDIKDRYEKVGGVPRHIFQNEVKYVDTLKDQKNAIHRLKKGQVQSLTLDNVTSAQTLESNLPESVIMVYKCPAGIFSDFSVSVASRHVAQILVEKKTKFLWDVMVDQGGTRGSTLWLLFEIYCQNLMTTTDGTKFVAFKYYNGVD